MSQNSIEQQTLAGLKWTAASRLVSQVLSWGVTIVVLRILVPEDYGLMAMLTVVIALLGNVAELGIGASVVQAPKLDDRELARLAGLVILFDVAACALVVALAPAIAAVFGDERLVLLLRVAALQFLLNALATIPQALAFRAMDFRWPALAELAGALAGSGTTLGLAWGGAGVWALVGGSLAQGVVRGALLLRSGWVTPEFSVAGTRHFVQFGGTVMLARLAWQVVFQSDILIAGRRLTSDAVGLYSVSLHLAMLPLQKIMGIVNQVALPAVARMQDEQSRLHARLLEAIQLMSVFSFAVMWGMSSVAPELVRVVLGAKWEGAIVPLQLITLVVPIRMMNALFSTAVIAVGKAGVDLVNTLVCALVLPAAFYAGTWWGPDGLAVAWIVAIPLITVVNLPRMTSAIGLRLSVVVASLWRPAVAGSAMYAAVALARYSLHRVDDPWMLPILVVIGAVVYLGVLNALLPRYAVDLYRRLRTMA